jgi:hypothetical protein
MNCIRNTLDRANLGSQVVGQPGGFQKVPNPTYSFKKGGAYKKKGTGNNLWQFKTQIAVANLIRLADGVLKPLIYRGFLGNSASQESRGKKGFAKCSAGLCNAILGLV